MLIVPHASLFEQITAAAVLGRVKLPLAEAMKALEKRTACRLLRVLCGSLSRTLGHVEVAGQEIK